VVIEEGRMSDRFYKEKVGKELRSDSYLCPRL
jgi:hypothetical protein